MRRAGKPCSAVSGSPFIATATRAARSSVIASSGVDAVNPSTECDSTMSASARTPALSSSVRMGTPVHVPVPSRSPPTGLETHVSVIRCSSNRMSSSSSKVRVNGSSTSPSTRSSHVTGSTAGGTSAVSIR